MPGDGVPPVMFDALPEGWTVWADEPEGRSVLAYRPDVFEGESYPAPCLPTIYVGTGSDRRPTARHVRDDGEWHARLFLEPEVRGPEERRESREAACAAAVEVARRFAAGEVDYRALYQVPREDYLDRLDALTGRGRES